ncbi:discoidin domain-containing protein [Sphingobacterium sp. E70]|uniref:discoidin domain-containing protein n=1 Tax=Sphingobacterium sp. E70 TaxID=2853439 RepID=UPI00211D0DD3|nr:discoidin domain-containing protein [Sphingobacterium sp. E70]ULT22210.1 discoidin domain-containing protein [Sphingobacterium sp. E70]
MVIETNGATSGIGFLPRQDKKTSGIPTKYRISTSVDGKKWTSVKEGEFSNIKANPILQQVFLKQAIIPSLSNLNQRNLLKGMS